MGAVVAAVVGAATGGTRRRIVVIGGGAAGMSAASAARRTDPAAEVVVCEAGPYAAYGLCGLPYWLGGVVESADRLFAYPPETFRADRGIDLRLDTPAAVVDAGAHEVTLASGERLAYDALVYAAGAAATRPPVPGLDHDRVFTVRFLPEAERLHALLAAGGVRRAVVVGGGYVGLETAEALAEAGVAVEVVEALPRLLTTVDEPVSALVLAEVERHASVRVGTRLAGVSERGPDAVTVDLAGGEALEADLVVVATGVRPVSELLTAAGAPAREDGALLVDACTRTGLPDVYAAGDCVAHHHAVLDAPAWIPLGPAANKTGRVAGTVAAGGDAAFRGVVGTAVVKVFDLAVARTGLGIGEATAAGLDPVATDIVARSRAKYYPGTAAVHVRLVHTREGRLLGAQLAGRDGVAKRVDVFATALHAGLDVDDLAALDLAYAPPYAPVYDPVLAAAQRAQRVLVRSAVGTGGADGAATAT